MFFGYLGPMLIETGEDGVIAPSPQQRTVLAVLLSRAGRPVAVDELAELVWDGRPPERAADTLRTCVMRLRRSLGGTAAARVVTRDRGYLIEVAEEEVDALRFARACRDGAAAYRAGQWAAARAALAGGLALWRGDPLADVPSQLLRDAEVPVLDRLRLQALQWRIDADLQLGGGEELVAELQELASREPLREQLQALLMTALALAGRASEALVVYQQARDLLVRELGIQPGPELRELQRLILAGEQVRPRATAFVPPAAQSVPRQLPATAGHFAGRAAELRELDVLLDRVDPRAGAATICVIGGMAGIGKTTLALHWAHRVADRFPGGQLYVNLGGFGPALTAPADALRGFLDALREPAKPLPADPDAQQALYRSLMADRRVLVVLDNARDEQQVRPLLPGSATCLTLITSRNRLGGVVATNGAIPLNLDLLTEAEARELLTSRLGPERLTAEPTAVGQIIAAGAGLPLALCIAAARAALTPKLPLRNLAAQLGQPGLDALSSTDPYADLRSVFSWSYRRLSPQAARLFRCLPLFPGSDVSAAAAASITPAGRISELLAEMTGAHLVEEYLPGRFRLHDLLARYARECSEHEDADEARREVLRRILTWYQCSVTAAIRLLIPADRAIFREMAQPDPEPARLTTPAQAVTWLETERRNLVAAVEVAAQLHFDAVAVTLPLRLRSLFQLRSYLRDWLHTHLIGVEAARRACDDEAEAYLHASAALAYDGLGRAEEGLDGLRRALMISQSRGDLTMQAAVRRALGIIYSGIGLMPEAIAEDEQAAALARETGNRGDEFRALVDLGWAYQHVGKLEEALSSYLAAQELDAASPDQFPTGVLDGNLASLYLELGRVADAIASASVALELSTRAGRRVVQAEAHQVLGDALHGAGRHSDALPHWRAALAMYRDLDDPRADEVAARLA